jgi:Uma2 family endonuclease
MSVALQHVPSHADAAEAESATGLRHELVDGELFAMSGGTPEHNRLSANTLGELYAQLRGKPCWAVGSDQKVHVHNDHDDAGLYPDIAVYCGDGDRSGAVRTALTNPTVVIEVLSTSSEAYDRGRKFELYRSLPSMQHYVLMAQDRKHIEVFDRHDGNRWLLRLAGEDETVELPAIGAELVVNDLYQGVLPKPAADA